MGSLTIFAGDFGSGKTEITLNFALEKARQYENVVLADLDLANPFFTPRLLKKMLAAGGVTLLAPENDLAFGDVPVIPQQTIIYLQQENHLFIDVAGDQAGAVILGYLNQFIHQRDGYEFYLVLNPYRPFAGSLNELKGLKQGLESTSRLKFSGIISNPNLVEESTVETVLEGHQQVLDLAHGLELPVKYLTVEERLSGCLPPECQEIAKGMKIYLRPAWLQGS